MPLPDQFSPNIPTNAAREAGMANAMASVSKGFAGLPFFPEYTFESQWGGAVWSSSSSSWTRMYVGSRPVETSIVKYVGPTGLRIRYSGSYFGQVPNNDTRIFHFEARILRFDGVIQMIRHLGSIIMASPDDIRSFYGESMIPSNEIPPGEYIVQMGLRRDGGIGAIGAIEYNHFTAHHLSVQEAIVPT